VKLWKRIALWSLVVVSIPFFVVYGINAFDRAPDPGIAGFRPHHSPVADADNAYYYLQGMHSAIGKAPAVAGKQLVEAYNAARKKGYTADTSPLPKIEQSAYGKPRLSFQGKTIDWCKRPFRHCIPLFLAHRAQVRRLLQDNRLLLARAVRLKEYRQYRNTMKPGIDAPFPDFDGSLHELTMARYALAADSGHATSALHSLQQDARFWRMVMDHADNLVGKIVATVFVDQDASLASEILSRYRLGPAQERIIADIARPLSPGELSMRNAFIGEYRLQVSMFDEMFRGASHGDGGSGRHPSRVENFFALPLLKRNATMNLVYERFRHDVDVGQLSPPALVKYVKKRKTDPRHHLSILGLIYNPVGKILNNIATPDFVPYISRVRNLDAKLRLITIQYRLHQRHIAKLAIPAWLAKLPVGLRDPYSGKPPAWDTQHSVLSFPVLNTKTGPDRDPLSTTLKVDL
jgi:hypothetical protein